MSKCIWKDIEGYVGLYKISDSGLVKSLPRNHRYGSKQEKILKKGKTKAQREGKTYPTVSLSKDGVVSEFKIHRLVAIAFIPNPENKPTVNHKNGIKNDNRVENLEWATHSEQNYHMWETGLMTASDKWKEAVSFKGRTHSNESKLKMRKAKLGKKLSDATKNKIGLSSKGRTHSDESKEKIRQSKLGKLLTDESKQKISNANKGKTAWNKGMTKKEQYEYRLEKNRTGNLVRVDN